MLQNWAGVYQTTDFLHWNAAVWVGLRLNDGFGLSFRVGLCRGFVSAFRPFATLGLGAIGFWPPPSAPVSLLRGR